MKRRNSNTTRVGALAVAGALCAAAAVGGQAQAAVATNTAPLRTAVTVGGVMEHLEAFQAIADANNDNRASGTSGHAASVDYVEGLLQDAGYTTTRQPFSYERTDFTGTALSQTAPAVVDSFRGEIEEALEHPVDYKSVLQERLARRAEVVTYVTVAEDGPAHDRSFIAVAEVEGEELGRGEGKTKKGAEQEAALHALDRLEAGI